MQVCIVDKVLLTNNDSDYFIIKIIIRYARRPELGDKFSSRHGQKGVLSNIVREGDMPFSERGIRPDLIMNPHGFPSRMTVGKIIELVGSKVVLTSGLHAHGTAFGISSCFVHTLEVIDKTLINQGFSYNGKDFLISGISGQSMVSYVFMGPVYYQKLKHMVLDKMYARAKGPRTMITRQVWAYILGAAQETERIK